MIREIVHIDEAKCDGCGLCVPACEEGAIRIVDGKARVVADNLCDGMGACLGHCPRGAITIERREAPDFDEAAVARHLAANGTRGAALHSGQARVDEARAPMPLGHGGCPGSRMQTFGASSVSPALKGSAPKRCDGRKPTAADDGDATPSELSHWPIQLRLLPPTAPVLQHASLLIAADCVPVAYADFQGRLLRGRAVLIGCPKLDDLPAYVEKLTQIIALNDLHEVVVARMEVPCCGGILAAVLEARRRAESSVRVRDVVISVRGELLATREVAA